ncbi:MAG: methylated-DNA--[protein]-cysteine S-methyltransferase [Coriobacteriales bacterium]|nr:methylated-DNA--[protein]-cysteine S-methyltransferase [Coriobacteriales bacterium]
MFLSVYKNSFVGDIYLKSDGENLTHLFFVNKQRFLKPFADDILDDSLLIFQETKKWLDIYFSGNVPNFLPKLDFSGQTDFRQAVCKEMLKIPYGQTCTYADIAKVIAHKQGKKTFSARAVGGAVGHNPISIICPCHRVVGASGSLTGYGGSMFRKVELLKLEGVDLNKFSIPTKGTAINFD